MEEVVIVGAGIAGLATAVALKRVGVSALVIERAGGLRATGAAISLLPNAWLALDALGVSHKLAPLYPPITKLYMIDVKTANVQPIHSTTNDGNARPVAGARCVHRKALLEALAEELPPDTIRFSSKLTSIQTIGEEDSSSTPSYIIVLEDGTTIRAKVVIGCDGVHSMIARKLGLRSPVHSGRWAARGLAVFPEGHGLSHANRQFVDLGRRGGLVTINDKEVYWFLTCKSPPKGIDETGSSDSIKEEVIENLAKGFPQIYLDVIYHCDLSTLTWAPLMLRLPWDLIIGNISDGNITVAGDAMHPMTPDLGQGGGLALEDAVVLGRYIALSVSGHGKINVQDVGRSLRGYTSERRWRVATVVAASFFSGWVQVAGSRWWFKVLRFLFYRFLLQQVVRALQYDCGRLPQQKEAKFE